MRFLCDFLFHFLLVNWATHYYENVAKQAFVCSAFIITLYQNRAQSAGKTECEKENKQTKKTIVECVRLCYT